jgi:hypothetical protein
MSAATKQPKRSPEAATMTKGELLKKIAAARGSLTTALLTGDPTAKLREYVRELEAEYAAIEQEEATQIAAQIAAQQAAQDAEGRRINEAAQTLLEARNARIAAITTRFPIPDMRSSYHA